MHKHKLRASLLLGTALGSSLVLANLIVSAPAQALEQTNTIVQQITSDDDRVVVNPSGNPLVEVLNRTGLAFANAAAASNNNAVPIAGELFLQSNSINQNVDVGTSLTLINSFKIDDPNFGISGTVVVDGVAAAQAAAAANQNDATGTVNSPGFDFTQDAAINQSFVVDTALIIVNSGDIDPPIGINATVVNNNIAGAQALAISNVNNAAVTVDNFAQTAEVSQLQSVEAAIQIDNSGDIVASQHGIYASAANQSIAFANAVDIDIENAGAVTADTFLQSATVNQVNRALINVNVVNSGDIQAGDDGIRAVATQTGIAFENESDVTLDNTGGAVAPVQNQNVQVDQLNLVQSNINIANGGVITAGDVGIFARVNPHNYNISNISNVTVTGAGAVDVNVNQRNQGNEGAITVVNSGSVTGGNIGVYAYQYSNGQTTIVNSGFITAGSGLAIETIGNATVIQNAGTIAGFIDLTDNDDLFTNQTGGVFQASGVSDFRMGLDLFTNEDGAIVDTANNAGLDEMTAFVGLETFQNYGTISLIDGAPGDLFTISNTVGGTDLDYIAGSNLAVDVSFRDQGSSDIFRIDGNVTGQTDVIVNNVDDAPGNFQSDGITVVQVRGNVDPEAFRLANGPIDTGFFLNDLFFEPDGPEFDEFELRSIGPSGGAFLLPQLITASQDIWHQTSDTWFDRSADLRTQLWRNAWSAPAVAGAMYVHGGSVKDGAVVAEPGGLSPAIWAKVSHGELEQDDTVRTSSLGRNFTFNLDRELFVADVQSGIDVTLKGVMNSSDVLLLSVFGGGVTANLTYDNLGGRRFDYEGGQVGAAATYLSGGLFVDALFNAQFLKIEPEAFGFSQDLDADAYGFRVDTGYRFGMGGRGLFFEPLLTLAYVDSDVDGFSFSGNTVSFQAEDSVRGRVGLRAGTSLAIQAVRFEPFVIASLWGELSDDDNRATLSSNGVRFGFRDQREDSWGEISLGTNTFLSGNHAFSAFSKVDLIFGEDTEGYVAQGGFRVQW